VLVERYLPGFKAGGPLRSVSNLVEQLGDEFEFYVVTRDRDAGDDQPYPAIRAGQWNQAGKAQVYYAAPEEWSPLRFLALAREVRPALVYVNSFFARSSWAAAVLRRVGLVRTPLVLAPRGELSDGALSIRPLRKRAYIRLGNSLRLWRGVLWQATSREEVSEIRSLMGEDTAVRLAPNVVAVRRAARGGEKRPGAARLVFISRLSPKKNLPFLLERLRKVAGSVRLEIYGDCREPGHLAHCRGIARELPGNVEVSFEGPVSHERVQAVLAGADFFVLPTLGENFGHAVFEALAAGCPVVISDATPWRSLEERGVGWDLPLSVTGVWEERLQRCVEMGAERHRQMAERAERYAAEWVAAGNIVEANRALLEAGCRGV
jgi:glycosyltransferase involved in cell wall biosynthesis